MKPLPPEILALIPNGIEKLELRCVVCTKILPRSRRRHGTCQPSESPCAKVLTMFKRYCLQLTKCPSCLHPATAKERTEFKEWRRKRGDLSVKGRPKKLQKSLDKFANDLPTPSVALCTIKPMEKPQDIASKNDAITASASNDLVSGKGRASPKRKRQTS